MLSQSKFNSADKKSESAKRLADNEEHSFLWSILLAASKDGRTRKKLEAFFTAKIKPSLNRQEDSNMQTLFRNGVIWLPLFDHQIETYSKLTLKILRECLNDFLLVSLLRISPQGLDPIININVLILICKFNHGDFNYYDILARILLYILQQ